MVARTYTGTVVGVDGLLVRVEAHVRRGLKAFKTVGLPDTAVRESKERVRSAIENSGFSFPEGKVTINLAPGYIKKQGSGCDLAVAVGIVSAMGEGPNKPFEDSVLLGELALDGTLRSVRGVLPIVTEARRRRKRRVFVPRTNAPEAALVRDIAVHAAGSLREVIDLLDAEDAQPFELSARTNERATDVDLDRDLDHDHDHDHDHDLADIKGQQAAKRALEIAAAGGHNALLVGPPGAGKSLLASRLPSLLPRLSDEEALEVTKIYSVAGLLDGAGLVERAPFRAPHHTISTPAMVGGGALPGEASLAHHGVLFLDELAEFPRSALETLRQPLEEGWVRIRRVDRMCSFPARFVLIAATNPCPCGYLGAQSRPCACTPGIIRRYQSRISGPLMDRIDFRVAVRALSSEEMLAAPSGERSSEVRARVSKARLIQHKRFRRSRSKLNSAMTPQQITRYCTLDQEGEKVLKRAVDALHLSARAFHRVLKVARTIADLADTPAIEPAHLQEALVYRTGGAPG
jgi:magnesium chelatase family protein